MAAFKRKKKEMSVDDIVSSGKSSCRTVKKNMVYFENKTKKSLKINESLLDGSAIYLDELEPEVSSIFFYHLERQIRGPNKENPKLVDKNLILSIYRNKIEIELVDSSFDKMKNVGLDNNLDFNKILNYNYAICYDRLILGKDEKYNLKLRFVVLKNRSDINSLVVDEFDKSLIVSGIVKSNHFIGYNKKWESLVSDEPRRKSFGEFINNLVFNKLGIQ